jgi:hypothetical protein
MLQAVAYDSCQEVMGAAALLPIVHWQLQFEFTQDTSLEQYKGNILHGGFGRSLAKVATSLYESLYTQPLNNNRWVSPFIISCTDERLNYSAGARLNIQLTLLADAVANKGQIIQALQQWQQLGFGPNRTPFILHSITEQQRLIYHHDLSIEAYVNSEKLVYHLQTSWQQRPTQWREQDVYCLNTLTRCRLQLKGAPINYVPSLYHWTLAIRRRFSQLVQRDERSLPLHGNDTPTVEPKIIEATFSDWRKFSVQSNRPVNIGGLTGQWCYSQLTELDYLWLLIGEQIGVGNKCSFGFGRYQGYLTRLQGF